MVVEGGAKFGLELEPADGEGVHRRVEKLGTIAAQGLGAAHGGFGIVEEVVGAIVGSVAEGDSDADAGRARRVSINVEGKCEGGLQAIGDAHGIARIANAFEQDGEFVAAETAEEEISGSGDIGRTGSFLIAKRRVETARDLDQDAVGGRRTEVGIPVLETIDVDEEDGVAESSFATGLREATLQAFEQDAAIG